MPTSKERESALVQIANFAFSFAEIFNEENDGFDPFSDISNGEGDIDAVATTLDARLRDLKESWQENDASGEGYPLPWAKEQWLDHIATLSGILRRRLERGEEVFESEGVTARLRKELGSFREMLLVVYPKRRLEQLESLERAELGELNGPK